MRPRMQAQPHPSQYLSLRESGRLVNPDPDATRRLNRLPAGLGQVSAEANNSSNLPGGWIDSQARRRYSLAQIPILVAHANPQYGQGASISVRAVLRASRIPAFAKNCFRRAEPDARRSRTLQCPAVSVLGCGPAGLYLIYTPASGAAPRNRNRRISEIKRAGGRQIL